MMRRGDDANGVMSRIHGIFMTGVQFFTRPSSRAGYGEGVLIGKRDPYAGDRVVASR